MPQHDVVWDESKISRFWTVVSQVLGDQFFSHVAGDLFLDIVGPQLGPRVLDFGCGDGFLVERLRGRGFDAIGVDPAPASKPFLHHASGEAVRELGASRFDSIVSLETFEHIVPAKLPDTLRALAHLLRPGGVLAFTVPFEEQLASQTCVCPDCHAVFHRWQHMQAFDETNLRALLGDAGFHSITLRPFSIPLPLPGIPRALRPTYSRFYAWVKRRVGKDAGVLVVARRR